MGETASYSYYSDGLRASKTIGSNTTRYYYNGDNVINETLNGSSYATNVMGVNGYVSRRQNGTTGYLFKDAHGDVLSAYSSTTNKLADYAYDAWGEQRSVGDYEWGNANPIRYNGQYYDTESGMTYLRARYYDSSFRRFITEDPIKDGMNWYSYCSNNPVMLVDSSGFKDYIYTSQTEYYIENDWGFWEFLNIDRYYAEVNGSRYQANSKETVTLYDWNSLDTNFLNETLDLLINKANEKKTTAKRILTESVGGDLDFKLQMEKEKLYLANGVLYNKNEAGNFVWAYFLESKNVSGYISGALAQGGSIIPPMVNMNGLPRLDEEWDRKARWAGVKYYYDRNDKWWIYYALYGGGIKY